MSLRDTCLLIFSSTLLLAIQKMWKVAKFLHIFNISLLTISQSANRYFEKTFFKVLPTQIFSNSIYSNSLYSADSTLFKSNYTFWFIFAVYKNILKKKTQSETQNCQQKSWELQIKNRKHKKRMKTKDRRNLSF